MSHKHAEALTTTFKITALIIYVDFMIWMTDIREFSPYMTILVKNRGIPIGFYIRPKKREKK